MTNHPYISIKKSLIDELNRIVPFAERQQFVEEVLTRELRRRRLRFALKKSYGAWKDEDHPELTSYDDVNSWVESIRKKDKPTLNEHNSI